MLRLGWEGDVEGQFWSVLCNQVRQIRMRIPIDDDDIGRCRCVHAVELQVLRRTYASESGMRNRGPASTRGLDDGTRFTNKKFRRKEKKRRAGGGEMEIESTTIYSDRDTVVLVGRAH